MKLSDYKVLLDLTKTIQEAVEGYFKTLNIPFSEIKVLSYQPTFVVVSRVYNGKDHIQSISIWSLVDDKIKGG